MKFRDKVNFSRIYKEQISDLNYEYYIEIGMHDRQCVIFVLQKEKDTGIIVRQNHYSCTELLNCTNAWNTEMLLRREQKSKENSCIYRFIICFFFGDFINIYNMIKLLPNRKNLLMLLKHIRLSRTMEGYIYINSITSDTCNLTYEGADILLQYKENEIVAAEVERREKF